MAEPKELLAALRRSFAGSDCESTLAYFQRAVGYTLTGDTREKCLFWCFGPTNSGKSTFVGFIRTMLGDYAMNTDFGIILEHHNTPHPEALMRLNGARMVTAGEVSPGGKVDAGKLKLYTGRDMVTARGMYKGSQDFMPQFKLWLHSNDLPKMDSDDAALWGRIHVIPFPHSLPADEQDKDLDIKLLREQDAILEWAIEGCAIWKQGGLRRPEHLIKATQQLRSDYDELAPFFEECLERNPALAIGSGVAYRAYKSWAIREGVDDRHFIGTTKFGIRMKNFAGHRSEFVSGERVYKGVGLRQGALASQLF